MPCHCSYCVGGREKKYDLNSIEDYDDEPRYRKVPKRVKYCKKSKTKDKCEFTVKKYKWAYSRKDEWGREYEVGHYTMACHRCGKEQGLHSFSTRILYPPFRSIYDMKNDTG
jgi:hypothetical protein